jgi:REP element-mobilizing transposase RayT
MPTPFYEPTADNGAHCLHYSWTGWPSGELFSRTPEELIHATEQMWQRDGLQLLEARWSPEQVHILFASDPTLSPQFVASRAKGRLDHAIREASLSLPFSRKVSVRSLGSNTRRDVETYIERQVQREGFVDSRFEHALEELVYVNDNVDLSQPATSSHGRYWYNVHLVLVTEHRWRMKDLATMQRVHDSMLAIASKKEHAISRLSVMPDHLHAALRPSIATSPLELAFTYLNNLTYMLNLGRMWQEGYYVGTFGEYTTHAIRD